MLKIELNYRAKCSHRNELVFKKLNHGQTSNKRCTLVGNKIVDHSDVVGASPVGNTPTISLFST